MASDNGEEYNSDLDLPPCLIPSVFDSHDDESELCAAFAEMSTETLFGPSPRPASSSSSWSSSSPVAPQLSEQAKRSAADAVELARQMAAASSGPPVLMSIPMPDLSGRCP